jgi:ribosomal protein L37AE/L43A
MAMNKIQFQRGMSYEEFHKLYGVEEQCEAALVKSRWPQGYCCPRCDVKRAALTHNGRRLWECLGCGYQCSSIAGTVMEATKLPLTKWFLAMFLLTQSKNAIASLELMRQLGVTYKTAWLMKHKLLEVMVQREAPRRLTGRVEVDDAYLGGEHEGKAGRGSENKVPFVAAVQTNGKGNPIAVRLDRVKSFSKESIDAWAKTGLAATAMVVSDGLWCFQAVTATVQAHQRIVTGSGRKAAKKPEFRWVNTLLGNLKTALSGTYHAFDFEKYGQRYLAEFQYRFNRRFDLRAMLPRLLRAAVLTKPQPSTKLRFSEVSN